MHVSEFVPKITSSEQRVVGVREMLATGQRLQHRQVRRLWSMQSREHRIHHSNTALRRDYEIGAQERGALLPNAGLCRRTVS